jgi:hypothetical protein
VSIDLTVPARLQTANADDNSSNNNNNTSLVATSADDEHAIEVWVNSFIHSFIHSFISFICKPLVARSRDAVCSQVSAHDLNEEEEDVIDVSLVAGLASDSEDEAVAVTAIAVDDAAEVVDSPPPEAMYDTLHFKIVKASLRYCIWLSFDDLIFIHRARRALGSALPTRRHTTRARSSSKRLYVFFFRLQKWYFTFFWLPGQARWCRCYRRTAAQ